MPLRHAGPDPPGGRVFAAPAALPQTDAPELAHVAIAQFAPIGQTEDDPRVAIVGRSWRRHDERAGHAQSHGHHPTIRELQQHALRPPSDARDHGAAELGGEPLRRLRMADRAIPAHLDVGDLRPGDPALQVACDCLDLGELRHAGSLA